MRATWTDERVATDGALASRILPDGRELTVYDYLFNDRVVIGHPDSPVWDQGWCYPKGMAVEAVAEWDGTGTPPGPWIKDAATGEPGPGMAWL